MTQPQHNNVNACHNLHVTHSDMYFHHLPTPTHTHPHPYPPTYTHMHPRSVCDRACLTECGGPGADSCKECALGYEEVEGSCTGEETGLH